MPTRENDKRVRKRARSIRKAQKAKLTTKDYIQRTLVVLIILAIIAVAYLYTRRGY